jgi:hypothetical protein
MRASHQIIGKEKGRVYGTTHSAWYLADSFLKLYVFAF